jgi:hypothetical protein
MLANWYEKSTIIPANGISAIIKVIKMEISRFVSILSRKPAMGCSIIANKAANASGASKNLARIKK